MPDQRMFYQIARAPTGPNSRTEPKARFGSFDDAAAEARRLASATGAAFVIMGVLATVQPADTRTGNLFGEGAA